MITVIAYAGTSLKLFEMNRDDSRNLADDVAADDVIVACQKLVDTLPDNAAVRSAIAEGREISAIVATLELPARLTAAAAIYPLVRDKLLRCDSLKNNGLDDLSRIVIGLVQLGQFSLPDDWRPGEALAVKQSEALRKMLLAIVSDVRLVLVRIAEQLYRLRQAKKSSRDVKPDSRSKRARSTPRLQAGLVFGNSSGNSKTSPSATSSPRPTSRSRRL